MGGEPTFAGAIVNGEVAPIPAIREGAIDRLRSGRLSDDGPIPGRPLAPGRHPKPLGKAGVQSLHEYPRSEAGRGCDTRGMALVTLGQRSPPTCDRCRSFSNTPGPAIMVLSLQTKNTKQ